MDETMPVVEMREAGAPEVLELGQRPVPEIKADEVLIEVVATGVNGPDIMQRKGLYPPPPGASDLLGLEVSGRIARVGSDVSDWNVGDEVCALTNGGGYAGFVAVEAGHCLPVPTGVPLEDAAGLPETYFTVWSNVFMDAKLCEGQSLLVHGGAGGIGTTAVQLGKAFGATVFATDTGEARLQLIRDLGADLVVDYAADDFVEAVREAGGADVILDIVGGDYIARNIKAAKPDGRIVQLAFAKGSKVDINLMPIMLKRLVYRGSTLRSRPSAQKSEIARQLREFVWPKFADGSLRPVTSVRLPLADAAKAHQMMQDAGHTGKILLDV